MSHFMEGKTINSIMIARDKMAVLFCCSDGNHIARTDADCCSHTWVENIEAPALGLPATVLSVSDLKMPDGKWADEDQYEYVQFYGVCLKTDKGDIVIDYRNSSNGYYGGNLVWPDYDYFYGGVFGGNVSSEEWESLP